MSANAVQTSDLTPKQEKAIGALLSQPTMEEAAEAAGVNRATIFRWLQQKEFQAAYTSARRESVKQAIARLQQTTSEAVDTLRDVMKSSTNFPAARVSAAKAILDYAMKAVELEDLTQRVEELEALMKPH
jgi:hypothetical protein